MVKKIKVNSRFIGNNNPVFIISEIGINHNGRFDLAKKLILESAKAGVDAVKFQKRTAESIMIKNKINKKPVGYLSKDENDISNDQLKYGSWSYPDIRVELSKKNYIELKKISLNEGVEFFASPWDEESLNFLLDIDVKILKIPSVEITNYEFLEKFSKTQIPIILSTGTATIEDIDKAIEIISKNNEDIILLQCTSAYPSKFNEIDLNVIKTFQKKYKYPIGYSGHEPGFHVPLAAVAIGAKVIEKHVTLNKKMNGTDHQASINMKELAEMVKCIRDVEQALGSENKKKHESENVLINILGKSLATVKALKAGSRISKTMITSKGPPKGIASSEFYKILGKKLKVDKKEDEIIYAQDIE